LLDNTLIIIYISSLAMLKHLSSSTFRVLSSHFIRPLSSSGGRIPPEEAKAASERVHGSIDPTLVRSKAMRAKLLKSNKSGTEASGKEDTQNSSSNNNNNNTASDSKELLSQRDQEQQQNYQQQQQYQAPTFGQVMYSNLVSGFGMAIGFMVVGVIFRALFGGGQPTHARQIQPQIQQQIPRYSPQQVEADPIFSDGSERPVEDDGDPYAAKTTTSSSSLARRSTSL